MSDDMDDDDLGLDDGLEEAGFENFEDKETTLGDLWRDNSLVKIGVIGAAAIAIFATISLLGGDEQKISQSYVPAGSEVKAPPGTEEATPAYIAAVEEENEARIEEAFLQGGSALPTPIDPPVGRLQIPDDNDDDKDPLQRWHQLQERRIQMELQNTDTLDLGEVPDDTERLESIQALAGQMSEQMGLFLEETSETVVQTLAITDSDFREQVAMINGEGGGGSLGGGLEGAEDGDGESGFFEDEDLENFGEQLLPAGEIVYAQLLIEANSDAPGPLLAQIVSGPFAGSRIIGTFSTGAGAGAGAGGGGGGGGGGGVHRDVLTLNFNTLVLDGESIGIDAIGVDPTTNLPGLATEVNHRYLQRIVLPMAVAFVEGAATAIAETGRTTVTINSSSGAVAEETQEADTDQEIATGVQEAGEELTEILSEFNESIRTLIRIEAGTPIGILFLSAVTTGGEGGGVQQ